MHTTIRSRFAAIGLAVGLIGLPATALAHDVTRDRGLYFGVKLVGASLDVAISGSALALDERGGGGYLFAGYSFNPVFSLELALGGTRHETGDPDTDAILGAFQLVAHYRFLPDRAFRPYAKGGIGAYNLTVEKPDVSTGIEGGGAAFGAGFDYFFTNHFSAGVDWTHNIVQFDKSKLDLGAVVPGAVIDRSGYSSTFGVSLAFYF